MDPLCHLGGGGLNPTLSITILNTQSKSTRDICQQVIEVLRCNLVREAKRSKRNIVPGINNEVLRNGTRTGILIRETGDGDLWVALIVELPVDATLRERHALELCEVLGDFHVESVIEDETGREGSLGDEGQDFGGARVDVGCVQAAGLKKESCEGDTEADEGWEVGAVGEDDFTTGTGCTRVRCGVEVEFEVGGAGFDCVAEGLDA